VASVPTDWLEESQFETFVSVISPLTTRAVAGVVVPMPTLPFALILNTEEVAKSDEVVEATSKSGFPERNPCCIESAEYEVVVPMLTLPPVKFAPPAMLAPPVTFKPPEAANRGIEVIRVGLFVTPVVEAVNVIAGCPKPVSIAKDPLLSLMSYCCWPLAPSIRYGRKKSLSLSW